MRKNYFIIGVGFLIVFIIWQGYLLKVFSYPENSISCGGDWSYKKTCPLGTYCRKSTTSPLQGGVCTPYIKRLFSIIFDARNISFNINRCALKADPGTCKACLISYEYDSILNTCKRVCDGGCDDAIVPFKTYYLCESTCVR